MLIKQRTYINGKLHRSSKPVERERAQHWLDNVEREWMKDGLFPLTAQGASDFNKCHQCERVSPDELRIVTTAGLELRIINK